MIKWKSTFLNLWGEKIITYIKKDPQMICNLLYYWNINVIYKSVSLRQVSSPMSRLRKGWFYWYKRNQLVTGVIGHAVTMVRGCSYRTMSVRVSWGRKCRHPFSRNARRSSEERYEHAPEATQRNMWLGPGCDSVATIDLQQPWFISLAWCFSLTAHVYNDVWPRNGRRSSPNVDICDR